LRGRRRKERTKVRGNGDDDHGDKRKERNARTDEAEKDEAAAKKLGGRLKS
jgi:hypothetical protein